MNNTLYAGLGFSANDADVFALNLLTNTWAKIGGDSLNSGWTTGYEEVFALALFRGQLVAGLGLSGGDSEVWLYNGSAIYKGKLYVATGNTANLDAGVYAFGEDPRVESTFSSQDTEWHHIAGT